MSAFAQTMWEANFIRRNKYELVGGTVSAILSYVAQVFKSNNRPDLRLDADSKTCFILQEQFRGYCYQDGTKLKQKALPMMVLRKVLELAVSQREKAIAWLLIGALFFAMISCEYLKVAPEETKWTKIIWVENVVLKKRNRVIQHNDPDLRSSDLVTIFFVFKKNDKHNKCIHWFKSGDTVLCLVISWATTFQRVYKIPE